MRVVHTTGYGYDGPVTSSYNEARLTPRSDGRQTVILSRVDTTPATRAYRYTDYWGSGVTAFDLHAPHTSLDVTGLSVVETTVSGPPDTVVDWDELRSETEVEQEIAKQVNSVAHMLELDSNQIFPVSAQKGLVAKINRDPAEVEKAISLRSAQLNGPTEDLRRQIQALSDIGIRHFTISLAPTERKLLSRFAKEVMPAFQGT